MLSRFFARALSLGFQTRYHLTRHTMYEKLSVLSEAWPASPSLKVLSVSGSELLCAVLRLDKSNLTSVKYPDVSLLKLPYESQAFDYVVADQVLEHIEGDPAEAFAEIHRVLKPGGIAVITTCFMNPVHMAPADFWRFTPNGLALLASRFSKVLQAGGWGNRMAVIFVGLGLRFLRIPLQKWHPLNFLARANHPEWPIVTWVAAQK